MTAAHTPTPWSRNINARYPIYAQHTREDVRHICSIVPGNSTTAEEKEANLRFIVKAVNAHDLLVAALVKAEQRIVELCGIANVLDKQLGGKGKKARAEDYAEEVRAIIIQQQLA